MADKAVMAPSGRAGLSWSSCHSFHQFIEWACLKQQWDDLRHAAKRNLRQTQKPSTKAAKSVEEHKSLVDQMWTTGSRHMQADRGSTGCFRTNCGFNRDKQSRENAETIRIIYIFVEFYSYFTTMTLCTRPRQQQPNWRPSDSQQGQYVLPFPNKHSHAFNARNSVCVQWQKCRSLK